ncbi:hypothetical protein PTKIN_Ptkin05aG0034000 [Pterospermum kingtungense]
MATLKLIWKLSKEVEIVALEENLLLFKFQGEWDKARILEGASWSFDKQRLLMHEFVTDWRPDDCLESGGCSFFFRIRVEIDITKPRRRVVKLIGCVGKKEIWGRITYERLATFYYLYGLLGHTDVECEANSGEMNKNIPQYGDWLRASSLKKGITFIKQYSSGISGGDQKPNSVTTQDIVEKGPKVLENEGKGDTKRSAGTKKWRRLAREIKEIEAMRKIDNGERKKDELERMEMDINRITKKGRELGMKQKAIETDQTVKAEF